MQVKSERKCFLFVFIPMVLTLNTTTRKKVWSNEETWIKQIRGDSLSLLWNEQISVIRQRGKFTNLPSPWRSYTAYWPNDICEIIRCLCWAQAKSYFRFTTSKPKSHSFRFLKLNKKSLPTTNEDQHAVLSYNKFYSSEYSLICSFIPRSFDWGCDLLSNSSMWGSRGYR